MHFFYLGEIRVGSKFQADNISPKCLTPSERESDTRRLQDLESLVWTPHHSLTDRQIDQFLVVSRSVGTFARALDCTSSVKQPSLHMSAAAASRDITLVCFSPFFLSYLVSLQFFYFNEICKFSANSFIKNINFDKEIHTK